MEYTFYVCNLTTGFHLKQTQRVWCISKCPTYIRSQYFYITTSKEFVVQVTNAALRTFEYRLGLDVFPRRLLSVRL